MLPHIPRFARLVFVAMILVVVPCLFFFYPDASSHAMRKLGMESGGIDSIHVRPKVPPNPIAPVEVEQVKESFDDSNEDEPVVDDEEESGEDKAAKADLAAHEKLADTKHTDTHADESIDHAHHTSAAASASALVDANLLGGGVIMPHLGNATAK
jgi:hypothetical protein